MQRDSRVTFAFTFAKLTQTLTYFWKRYNLDALYIARVKFSQPKVCSRNINFERPKK